MAGDGLIDATVGSDPVTDDGVPDPEVKDDRVSDVVTLSAAGLAELTAIAELDVLTGGLL